MDIARLEQVAAELQPLLGSPAEIRTTPEIAARHRVFASVLRATSDHLSVLKRLATAADKETPWAP